MHKRGVDAGGGGGESYSSSRRDAMELHPDLSSSVSSRRSGEQAGAHACAGCKGGGQQDRM
jgi:hypothetical protein